MDALSPRDKSGQWLGLPPLRRPRLLVSVGDPDEAMAALAGGADIIDAKAPEAGPMGRVAIHRLREIEKILPVHVPLTAAAGELADLDDDWLAALPPRTAAVKFGLAGWGNSSGLAGELAAVAALLPAGMAMVPVAYADTNASQGPQIPLVLQTASALPRCHTVLVDTYDKQSGRLLDWCSLDSVREFLKASDHAGLHLVLAGRLSNDDAYRLIPLGPAALGFRSAACGGNRTAGIRSECVAALRALIGVDGSVVTA